MINRFLSALAFIFVIGYIAIVPSDEDFCKDAQDYQECIDLLKGR